MRALIGGATIPYHQVHLEKTQYHMRRWDRPSAQGGGISRRLSRQRNLALNNSIRGERELLSIDFTERRRIWHLGFGDRRKVWPGTLK